MDVTCTPHVDHVAGNLLADPMHWLFHTPTASTALMVRARPDRRETHGVAIRIAYEDGLCQAELQ